MTVDKDKRRLIDIVDSIEAKLNKIIGDNNMGNLKYTRDSISEIPTFYSNKKDNSIIEKKPLKAIITYKDGTSSEYGQLLNITISIDYRNQDYDIDPRDIKNIEIMESE
jgi:hypothetical protein